MKRYFLVLSLLLFAIPLLHAARRSPRDAQQTANGEWRSYAADSWCTKYSPLDQINRDNVKQLRIAWRWWSPDNELVKENHQLRPGPNESTPLMIRGVLYTPTGLNQVCAIDAATGRTIWVYNPNSHGFVHRGVAYWENGTDRRLFLTTKDAYLIAIDPDNGKPIPSFGANGRVDLTKGLRRPVNRSIVSNTSPPIVCRDVVVVGGSVDDFQDRKEMPPGDVRGFDVRTGKQLWRFQSIPQEGEFGNETWQDGSWKYSGSVNVWSYMSCDPELGYVYLPFGTANNDWYGGHRPGDNLFSESVVCLDARTGKRVWHFQTVHHGLWDYDLPCAPNLIDVTQNGKRIKAIAQVTKQAFCFVFDRVTGKPLWPIEERPVPPTVMPGDKASPTQPFPTKPSPFDRQGITDDDIIDFTPELKMEAKQILNDYAYGPLYTPPRLKKTIEMPGWVGGASWAGASADPETGILYVPSISNPMWAQLDKPNHWAATVDFKLGESGAKVDGPDGLPVCKPPYGRITAIDLNAGNHLRMSPVGDGPRDHPRLKHLDLPRLGWYRRPYIIVTKTLLLVVQEGSWFSSEIPKFPPKLFAYDKKTGQLLAEVDMPANTHATGAPITYLMNGKQYVVVPIGGGIFPAEMIALSVP